MDVISELEKARPAVYLGFDPTASSLHLGHMTALAPLLYLARNGFEIIGLVTSFFNMYTNEYTS